MSNAEKIALLFAAWMVGCTLVVGMLMAVMSGYGG
jgi:hypothetical protein